MALGSVYRRREPRRLATRRKPILYWLVLPAVIVVAVASWAAAARPWALASADVPVSQGKPASASSVEGPHYPASAAVDGDASTRWSSVAADPQWLMIDLGGDYDVTHVVLKWQTAYAKTYQVEVSTTGSDWRSVYDATAASGGTQALAVAGTARFVRLYLTTRATRYGYSLWEFQVFGTAANGITPSSAPPSPAAPSPAAPSPAPPSPAPPTSQPAPSTIPSTTPTGGAGTVLLPTPIAPIVSTGTPPQAQYQEIHADCGVTRHLSDDPIVFPGLPGASHNHTFVGNTTTDASSTTASLAAGGTSCQDGQDMSAYWFPTLYQHGGAVDPSTVTVYYKSGVRDYRTVQPFPPGFRLIVGSPKTPDAAHFQGNWQCGNQGLSKDFLPSCPDGSVLIVHLKAPSCWDGRTLDNPSHSSYMTFPVNGVCPADHPVALPMLEIKVAYKLPGGHTDGLVYSSGGSYSFHYDFMNGWVQSRLIYLTKHCINEGRQCNGVGVDQHKP
ncbi:MAG: hypothetical protein QOE61_236 [Micromonosporaceae bacterium]|nr:hypothetical protein [Micromonosporaceae bacterium]